MMIRFVSNKEYRWMGNFHSSPILHQGKVWPTVEHLYQACKALNPADQEKIRNASSPKEAKRIGRSINCRSNWDEMRLDVMKKILRLKFTISKKPTTLVVGSWNISLTTTYLSSTI